MEKVKFSESKIRKLEIIPYAFDLGKILIYS